MNDQIAILRDRAHVLNESAKDLAGQARRLLEEAATLEAGCVRAARQRYGIGGMVTPETFVLTNDHLALLQRSYVDHDYGTNGAPAINAKRPYGDSSVGAGIPEILGWKPHRQCTPEENDERIEVALEIHREMGTALQIVLCTQSFVAGTYRRAVRYNARSWRLETDR